MVFYFVLFQYTPLYTTKILLHKKCSIFIQKCELLLYYHIAWSNKSRLPGIYVHTQKYTVLTNIMMSRGTLLYEWHTHIEKKKIQHYFRIKKKSKIILEGRCTLFVLEKNMIIFKQITLISWGKIHGVKERVITWFGK